MNYTIKVCHGGSCRRSFAADIKSKLEKETSKKNLHHVNIEECRCIGLCSQSPSIVITEEESLISTTKTNINPGKIVEDLEHILK